MICDNLTVSNGRLLFAGQDTVELARQYGTPLYLMDEDRIRANCRVYTEAFRRHFGPGARPLYASKANSFQRIYEIMREEGMGIDVVSSGEIYTALRAGYDLGQAYFHSNNKTDEDIRYSMDHGIGYFVADNVEASTPTPMRPSPPARWTPNSAAPSRPARPRRSPSSPSASPMWSWWASTATWAPRSLPRTYLNGPQ